MGDGLVVLKVAGTVDGECRAGLTDRRNGKAEVLLGIQSGTCRCRIGVIEKKGRKRSDRHRTNRAFAGDR